MAKQTDGRRWQWTSFDDYALLITILFAVALWWMWVIGLGPANLPGIAGLG